MSEMEYDYDYDYVDSVPAALECPICRCALVDPVKTPDCDHLFCRPCLEKSLAIAPKCPIDRSPLPRGIAACTQPHRALVQLVGDLRVNYKGQTITRDEADRLVAVAKAQAQAGGHLNPGEQDSPHAKPLEEAATAAAVPCEHCTLVLPLASHPAHLLSTCTVIPRPCPHAARGCPYTGPRALLEQDHLPSECAYEPLSDYFDRADTQVLHLENENWHLRQRVKVAEERLDRLTKVMEALTASLGEFAPPFEAAAVVVGDDLDADRTATSSALPRPAPTERTSSSSSSTTHSTNPTHPVPSSASSPSALVSTLSHLQHNTSHLSSSLSTLAQSHSHQLGTTLALSEDVASLRTQLTGVRIQMGNVMRDVYGGGGGGGGGGGSSRNHRSSFTGGPVAFSLAGGGVGGGGLRVPPSRGAQANNNGGGGSSGSSDDDHEDSSSYDLHRRPPPQHRHNPNDEASSSYYSYEDDPYSNYSYPLHPQSPAHAMMPLRLPMGMRAVHNMPLPGGGMGSGMGMAMHGGLLPLGHGFGQNGAAGGGGGGLVKL